MLLRLVFGMFMKFFFSRSRVNAYNVGLSVRTNAVFNQ